MSKKPKILWSGDIVARTGFARVTENLITRLKDRYEIVILGNNWWGDPNDYQKEFEMYPSSNRFQTEPFGVQRIREITELVKPDLVFVNNDCWIVNQIYDQIKDLHQQEQFKFIAYMPMDSYGWTGCVGDFSNLWDLVISYTEFGAKEFLKAGLQKPVAVIPHGITSGQFYPKDKVACRKELNLNPDDFIVFNGNRNQARKRIDITIEAFARFAVDKPDTKLYLHMGKKDQGWDVMQLFGREMGKQGIDANNRIIMTADTPAPPSVPVELLNTIYNCADVGINTCKGEGHGLVNHEHGSCRVAQIVPDHTSLKEIFQDTGEMIRSDFIDVDMNYNREMPCPSAEHLAEILDSYYHDRKLLQDVADRCYDRATDTKSQWATVAEQFNEQFQEVLNKPPEPPEIQVLPRKSRRKKNKNKVAA